jgi:uncharacterized Zn-finger protein
MTPTSPAAQISPTNHVDMKLYPTTGHVRGFEKREATRSAPEIPKYQEPHTKVNQRGRKKSKRSFEQQPEEVTDNYVPKKIRKGQPKKTVVYYYETAEEAKARENNGLHKAPFTKDDSRFIKNYTHEKRHYANEHGRYHKHEQATQSHGTSSDNYYSHRGGKQTGSFAMQNDRESLEQGKPDLKGTQKLEKNNDAFDKNAGLENVMIVEYHSMSRNRENNYRSNEQKTSGIVTQPTSQGYFAPPRSVHSTNYGSMTSSMTTTAPAQIPPPERAHVQAVNKQDISRNQEPETKVVYVPVYPVSQGPNGVIYEAIPNATPIMAKDTLQVQQAQPVPQQGQQQQQQPRPMPQMVQPGQEVVVRRVLSSPPMPPTPESEQKSRIEYRAYEPRMPQQLTAAPAPQSFQPHPQGHVMMQPQTAESMRIASSPPYPPQNTTLMQLTQYQASRPPHPHQYQPRPEQSQNSHAAQQPLSYRPQHPSVSVSQAVTTRGPDPSVQHYQPTRSAVPISQAYQEVPRQYGQQQSQPPMQHPGYQREGMVVQVVRSSYGQPVNVVAAQQPMYQERINQPRPPPLPSQPLHAEKPALPSPSYPQESANRLPTPRYTPEGINHEQKFVYAPPPADFMDSPVYRVPTNEEKNKNIFYSGRVNNKTGSKKRKSSFPAHTVMPRTTEEHQEIPSPVESHSRTPSPKETDLRCNERLVKSPNQPSSLIKSSLVITPPVSPTDGEDENIETVTVVVRDQGIQASPRDERGMKILEHTCYKRAIAISHVRSNSYHSESSEEEEFLEDENSDKKSMDKNEMGSHFSPQSEDDEDEDDEMYTEDGTVVVHIPYSENNNNVRKQRTRKGNYRFVCRFCTKGFQWHSHLESHERTHTGEKPFKCPECDRAFCRADGLQCHMLVHNKKRPFKCPYCGKGFNDKIVLEKHIYSHTGVKPFKCEYCGRAFSDSLSIEKHLLVHTGTKPYKCPYCVRSFNDSQMLVRHIRSHTGEKPFKCKHCPMAFSKQSALIIHTRVHTGEKPYQCPHCVKSFSISGNLQRHILIHTGERPYQCSKCPKAFNNPSHLSRHISKLHAPQPGGVKDQIKYEQFQAERQYRSQQET